MSNDTIEFPVSSLQILLAVIEELVQHLEDANTSESLPLGELTIQEDGLKEKINRSRELLEEYGW